MLWDCCCKSWAPLNTKSIHLHVLSVAVQRIRRPESEWNGDGELRAKHIHTLRPFYTWPHTHFSKCTHTIIGCTISWKEKILNSNHSNNNRSHWPIKDLPVATYVLSFMQWNKYFLQKNNHLKMVFVQQSRSNAFQHIRSCSTLLAFSS